MSRFDANAIILLEFEDRFCLYPAITGSSGNPERKWSNWSPDFSRNWDLRIHPRPCVRPCVRPSVRKILNDYPLFFSEILHGVTTLYGGNVTFSDF